MNLVKKEDFKVMNKHAKDVLKIVSEGMYCSTSGDCFFLEDEFLYSVNNTELYDSYDFEEMKWEKVFNTPANVIVTNETTTNALQRLSAFGLEDLVALNFASGKHPGGGFIRGSKAQEEDLCRSSNLYHCLIPFEEDFYQEDPANKDYVLYSPKVVFFKDEKYVNLDQPFHADIITCAAPNISGQPKLKNTPQLVNLINNRVYGILASAAFNKRKNIVLGAWGSGVFGNDPMVVALAFKKWLDTPLFNRCFENIVFAVYDKSINQENFNAFNKVFGE